MSGIAGYLGDDPRGSAVEWIWSSLASLRRRGPDDEGVCLGDRGASELWSVRTNRTADAVSSDLCSLEEADRALDRYDFALLGTRYGATDRTTAAHQPFLTRDRSFVGVFDGEIYILGELRADLSARGTMLRTGSGVEVLLEGYRAWGRDLWSRLNGFWAAALYDVGIRTLVLSRDRFGIAPLYYRQTPDTLYFGSNIACVVAPDADARRVRRPIVQGFIDTGVKDFDARTCWRSVRSMKPGRVLELGPQANRWRQGRAQRFWTFPEQPWTTDDLSFEEAVSRFRETFFDAVRRRLDADREVALELSGGLDSSAIVAAAAVQGADPTTYTLKVHERDEEPIARTMCDLHDLNYRVVHQDHGSFPERGYRFAALMEEPFQSPNAWAHYRMLRRMKDDGKGIVLTGSGGDSLLAGYEPDVWPAARRTLFENGHAVQARICGLFFKFATWDRTKGTIRWLRGRLGDAVGNRGTSDSPAGSSESDTLTPGSEMVARYREMDFHHKRLFEFRRAFLPYALAADVHFSMDLPVRMRTPFLDHRLVEFGLRLPAAYLFRRGYTKWILRKALARHLPPEILWRREKFGFPFPHRSFLREHRAFLTPSLETARDRGFAQGARGRDWEDLVDEFPQWLWRLCSAGMWMRVMGMDGGIASADQGDP